MGLKRHAGHPPNKSFRFNDVAPACKATTFDLNLVPPYTPLVVNKSYFALIIYLYLRMKDRATVER